VDYCNGFYERDYLTPVGVIRRRISRTRKRSFLPRWIGRLEPPAPEVAELIRQAFLRGISTVQVGRVIAVLTGEGVSAQTVSRLTRVLDQAVRAFHQRPLGDDWAYVILDGVWLKVRRPSGPQRVLQLVAYGVRPSSERRCPPRSSSGADDGLAAGDRTGGSAPGAHESECAQPEVRESPFGIARRPRFRQSHRRIAGNVRGVLLPRSARFLPERHGALFARSRTPLCGLALADGLWESGARTAPHAASQLAAPLPTAGAGA
jgi:Transposase, Mutator family